MSHTYVLAASGRSIDFDRALLVMDSDLLRASVKAINGPAASIPDHHLLPDGGIVSPTVLRKDGYRLYSSPAKKRECMSTPLR